MELDKQQPLPKVEDITDSLEPSAEMTPKAEKSLVDLDAARKDRMKLVEEVVDYNDLPFPETPEELAKYNALVIAQDDPSTTPNDPWTDNIPDTPNTTPNTTPTSPTPTPPTPPKTAERHMVDVLPPEGPYKSDSTVSTPGFERTTTTLTPNPFPDLADVKQEPKWLWDRIKSKIF